MKYLEVEKIQTRKDFITFLRSLKKDYVENLSSWENRDLGRFLEAMEGFYINKGLEVPEKSDWKVFADVLMGGKVYE